jgi:hypothetical protein
VKGSNKGSQKEQRRERIDEGRKKLIEKRRIGGSKQGIKEEENEWM